eukprot:scaffold12349_cov87-Isochrysis_galbana.AAC.1
MYRPAQRTSSSKECRTASSSPPPPPTRASSPVKQVGHNTAGRASAGRRVACGPAASRRAPLGMIPCSSMTRHSSAQVPQPSPVAFAMDCARPRMGVLPSANNILGTLPAARHRGARRSPLRLPSPAAMPLRPSAPQRVPPHPNPNPTLTLTLSPTTSPAPPSCTLGPPPLPTQHFPPHTFPTGSARPGW